MNDTYFILKHSIHISSIIHNVISALPAEGEPLNASGESQGAW